MQVNIEILLLDDLAERAAIPALAISFALLGARRTSTEYVWEASLLLDTDLHVRVTPVSIRSEAIRLLHTSEARERYDMVLLDVNWTSGHGSGRDGIEWVEELNSKAIYFPFLALYTTGDSLIERHDLIKMLACGAKAIIRKDEPYFFLNTLCMLAEIRRKRQLESMLLKGLAEVDRRLQTASPIMKTCLANAAAYAGRNSLPIMLLGPTGSGKEVIARAIHKASRRHGMPFEVVNCAAIPRELAEMELFGAEKGSYTGATMSRRGAFDRANGGTLFLDEVDRLSPEVQFKVLRAADDGEFRALGGERARHADIRIISATSRDIRSQLTDGSFSRDLYARLAGGVVQVPSLRERREDIPDLAQSILDSILSTEAQTPGTISFTSEALRALCEHDWRFNIRGLRMAIERSLSRLSPDRMVIRAEDLILEPSIETDHSSTGHGSVDTERLLLLRPKAGNQQGIFDALVSQAGDWVSQAELLKVLNLTDMNLFYTKVAQLRRRLESHGFTVELDSNHGYRIREYVEVTA